MPAPQHLHQTHPEIIKRLKRAEGHLRSIAEMIEAGRPCVDIAQQLDHCLEQAVGSLNRDQRGPVDEFKTITKYL